MVMKGRVIRGASQPVKDTKDYWKTSVPFESCVSLVFCRGLFKGDAGTYYPSTICR